jgi:hypothetical protein
VTLSNKFDVSIKALITAQVFVYSYFVVVEYFIFRLEKLSVQFKFQQVLKTTKFLSWFYLKRDDKTYNNILSHQAYAYLVLEQFDDFKNTIQTINHSDFASRIELYKCILYSAQERFVDLESAYEDIEKFLSVNKNLDWVSELFKAVIAFGKENYDKSYEIFSSLENSSLEFYQKMIDRYLQQINSIRSSSNTYVDNQST